MLRPLMKRLFGKGRPQTPARRNTFRPQLLVFEDRVVPANLTWVGPAGGNWSVAANWAPAQVPGNGDTVVFDGGGAAGGANTNSTMDLGGGAQYHIGRLRVNASYTQAVTLNTTLYVDVLEMFGGTVTGGTSLAITQQTTNQAVGPATIFATSFWESGTISTNELWIGGEATHRATLQIGRAGVVQSPTLDANLTVANQSTTVNWSAGSVTVTAGKTINNFGTFVADSPGSMGNNGGAAQRWNFTNRGSLYMGRENFRNANTTNPGGRVFRPMASDGTPGSFEVAGTFTQDGGETNVEAGTLSVTESATFNSGTLTVEADTTLSVTGDFTQGYGNLLNMELGATSGLITVAGTVSLGGALSLSGSADPGAGAVLIDNTGSSPVSGTFQDIPEKWIIQVGTQYYQISYEGGDGNDVTLRKPESLISVSSSANPSAVGDTVMLTAVVGAKGGGGPFLTGTVTFYVDGVAVGTAEVDTTGIATIEVSDLSVGVHAITAEYSGDDVYEGSTSDAYSQTVDKAYAMIMGDVPGWVTAGQSFTLGATVSGTGSLTPTGTVTFTLIDENGNETSLGSGTLDEFGYASISASVATAGTYQIRIDYSGDANFLAAIDWGGLTVDPA